MRNGLLFVLLSVSGSVMAHGNAVSVLAVRAEVRPSAVLKLEASTPQLVISAADIERGYVEIPAAALLGMTAGKFRPLIFIDGAPLASEGGVYRFRLPERAAPGVMPVTLGIEL
jgi:hypothetical protein